MGGGWYCDKHKVRFENQNYCELCKLDDMRCPYCKCPGGSHYCECVVFSINRQEQKPMTREEAVTKCMSDVMGRDQARAFVFNLEALGLLKFDESVTPESIVEFNFKASGVDNPKLRTKEVIGHLARCGYKIVRNSS